MSRAVRRVTRGVRRVVRGVTKAVRSVARGAGNVVRRIAGSRLGRVLLAAATIYFGGAAIMGAMKGAGAAGGGFLKTISGAVSGAGTGIANAWTGLKAAGSAAMSGNIMGQGGALSNLGAGVQGNLLAAPSTAAVGTGLTTGGGMGMTGATGAPGLTAPASMAAPSANLAAATAPGAGAGAGSGFWGTNAGAATVLAGGQIAGGLIQGAGQQRALEEQRDFEQAEIDRRNREMAEGRFTFGDARDSNFRPTQTGGGSSYYSTPNQTSGPALVRTGGMIASRMSDNDFQYSFPTFNPAMSRFYG